MKRNEEAKIRATLIEAMERWWSNEDGTQGIAASALPLPTLGDATLTFMAEAALSVLLAISDHETALIEGGMMKDESED